MWFSLELTAAGTRQDRNPQRKGPHVTYMHLFVYTKYVPGAYRIQERGWDSLEFKLGVVVSHFVDAQNHTVSSKRVMSALNHWALSLQPSHFIYLFFACLFLSSLDSQLV